MRLVTLLLLIQMGYIIAKAIESPSSCKHFTENDPRLKRSDEKETDLEDTRGTDRDDMANRKTFSKTNNENGNNHHDITDDDNNKNSNEFVSKSNILPQKLPLVNNPKFPVNAKKEDIVTDRLTTTKDAMQQQPVYYKAIDPKYLIISGLSLPKPNKNISNFSKSEDPVNIHFKETVTKPLDYYSNLTKATNVSNGDKANDAVRKEIVINDTDTNVSNIRELREHLLDHLLDYFLNIIKEENHIRINDTRKKNGKDRMKVEEKLRNYYDPPHLDMLFDDDNNDDDYYYYNNLDLSDNYTGSDSEEDLLDNVKQNNEVNKEIITNVEPPNALTDEVEKNTDEAHIFPEDVKNETMNLEQNLNSSSPDGESFDVNLTEPSHVTSKYVNLIEKETDLNNASLNKTENSEEAFDSNINIITTTESSVSKEALNHKVAEIDTDLLDYSEEAVTDRIEYVYDNDALTVADYTSYEDFIDSDEFEVVKNVTVHENNRNLIVITTKNVRRKNGLDKEKHIANDTLNVTYNNTKSSQIRNPETTSKDIVLKRKDKPNNLLSHKNKNDNSPCNEDNFAENKNKNSLENSREGFKRKLRNNKNCGKLFTKNNKLINKKSNKHNCRKSIILNLNINLI